MTETEDILRQEPTLKDVMNALADINKRLDSHEAQFEVVREGIVHNSVAFDRLLASVFNLRADVKEMSEKVRKDKLALK